jgi:hypothetical protein
MSADKELLKELLDGNVIAVISKDGDVVFLMDEEDMIENDKQAEMFTRFYLCTEPSFVLKIVLKIEGLLSYLSSFFTKD